MRPLSPDSLPEVSELLTEVTCRPLFPVEHPRFVCTLLQPAHPLMPPNSHSLNFLPAPPPPPAPHDCWPLVCRLLLLRLFVLSCEDSRPPGRGRLTRKEMQLRSMGTWSTCGALGLHTVAPWGTRCKPTLSGRSQVFAASDDRIGLYTRYMRGQIKSYLTNHLRLVPDAVVLVATLRATPASPGAPDAPSDPPLTSSGAAAGCTDCSSRDAEASNDSSISSISSGGSSIGGSDGENPLSLGGLATRNSAAVLRQPGQARRSASTTLVTFSPLPSAGRCTCLSVSARTTSEVQWPKCEP